MNARRPARRVRSPGQNFPVTVEHLLARGQESGEAHLWRAIDLALARMDWALTLMASEEAAKGKKKKKQEEEKQEASAGETAGRHLLSRFARLGPAIADAIA